MLSAGFSPAGQSVGSKEVPAKVSSQRYSGTIPEIATKAWRVSTESECN